LRDLAAMARLPLVGALVSLRIMARPASDLSSDVTVYLVEEEFGDHARGYVKTDAAEADLETIIRNLISGRYENPLRVVAFNIAERWSQAVSEDIANELLDRPHDADETLTDGTKRFIKRYVTLGERRPPASSVWRERDQTIRKKA
jgi:hypothetical protein